MAKQLLNNLGYKFNNMELYHQALSHCSFGKKNNERLEFLGDSILNFIVAEELYTKFPKATEGELTQMRSLLVRGENLTKIAKKLDIGKYIKLGSGEQRTGGHQRHSVLEDCLEAIIGAIYLDSNDISSTRAIVLNILSEDFSNLDYKIKSGSLLEKDAKTKLQEYLQKRSADLPEYKVVAIYGKPHQQIFKISCKIKLLPEPVFTTAASIKKAEQLAAQQVLVNLCINEESFYE